MSLNRKEILEAAIKLVEQDGLQNLSMRKLAQHMGVGTMSLYNHVQHKDDVLDGILALVLDKIAISSEERDWKTVLRARALSAFGVFSQYPWASALMYAELKQGRAQLSYHNAVLGSFRQLGFSPAFAIQATSVLDSYVYGYLQKSQTRAFANTDELLGVAEQAMMQKLLSDYPYILEAVTDLVQHPERYDPEKEFRWGLELILDGLEAAAPSFDVSP